MALAEFAMLAAMCAPHVDVSTLQMLVRHESLSNPYAIGVNGDYKLPRQPSSRQEAIATAEWLQGNGYDFDAGLGQINIRNIAGLGMSISDLFEPCANLKGAAAVLTDCYARAVPRYGEGQPALLAALSCYNTGNFERGFANGYVAKLVTNTSMKVPALESLPGGTVREPIRLQGDLNGTGSKAEKKPDEGIGDAFEKAGGDAFELEKKETDVIDGERMDSGLKFNLDR